MADLSLLPPSAVADGDDLRIAGVSLRELAQEFGTPAYVLDEDYLRARARRVRQLVHQPASAQPDLLRGQGVPVRVGHPDLRRGGPGL